MYKKLSSEFFYIQITKICYIIKSKIIESDLILSLPFIKLIQSITNKNFHIIILFNILFL